MSRASDLLSIVNVAIFVFLAVRALLLWHRTRSEAARWVALTFGVLSIFAIGSFLLPQGSHELVVESTRRVLVSLLVLFPYTLFRFMASFGEYSRTVHRIGAAATVVLIGWTLAVQLPSPDEPTPGWFTAYIILLLAQWTLLSAATAWRLWRAGTGQPTAARRRMRLLSAATLAMNGALVILGVSSAASSQSVIFGAQSVGLLSALLFTLGFAPPSILRLAWRRPEEERLQSAVAELMTATDAQSVGRSLLPTVTSIVAARAAALLDDEGEVLASHGEMDPRTDGDAMQVDLSSGSLIVQTNPYMPFFGRPELDMLQALGALGGLSLERARLFEAERSARSQLERANRDLAEAQDLARVGSWEWDIVTDNITWSDSLFRIFGLEAGGIAPTYEEFLSRVHAEDRDRVAANVDRALETGEFADLEHRAVTPEGRVRVIFARGRVVIDDRGRPIKMIGTAQDVTQQRQAEKATQEFAAIVDSTSDAIYGRDQNGIITSWNKGAERLYGYTAAEMLGNSVLVLIPDDKRAEHEDMQETIVTGRAVESQRTERLHKDGSRLQVSLTVSPIRDELRNVVGTSTIARDISEQIVAEMYERRLAEARMRQQQALELNDNIVQGLAVTKYSMELGLSDKSRETLERTLEAARRIVTDLMKEAGTERRVEPGDLVRGDAAVLDVDDHSSPRESS